VEKPEEELEEEPEEEQEEPKGEGEKESEDMEEEPRRNLISGRRRRSQKRRSLKRRRIQRRGRRRRSQRKRTQRRNQIRNLRMGSRRRTQKLFFKNMYSTFYHFCVRINIPYQYSNEPRGNENLSFEIMEKIKLNNVSYPIKSRKGFPARGSFSFHIHKVQIFS
jgi:hypothetical protein